MSFDGVAAAVTGLMIGGRPPSAGIRGSSISAVAAPEGAVSVLRDLRALRGMRPPLPRGPEPRLDCASLRHRARFGAAMPPAPGSPERRRMPAGAPRSVPAHLPAATPAPGSPERRRRSNLPEDMPTRPRSDTRAPKPGAPPGICRTRLPPVGCTRSDTRAPKPGAPRGSGPPVSRPRARSDTRAPKPGAPSSVQRSVPIRIPSPQRHPRPEARSAVVGPAERPDPHPLPAATPAPRSPERPGQRNRLVRFLHPAATPAPRSPERP